MDKQIPYSAIKNPQRKSANFLAESFGDLHEDTRSRLLIELSEEDENAGIIVKLLADNLDILPENIRDELWVKLRLVRHERPRYVCEIGVDMGGTFYLWCKSARKDATIVGIDLWGIRQEFYKHFAGEEQKAYLLSMDSHKQETAEYVRSLFGENRIDFLLIDGEHSYEGVKADFELYKPLMQKGGIVAIHDIVPTPIPSIGVDRFWAEIRQEYETQEFVMKYGPFAKKVGVGVIRL